MSLPSNSEEFAGKRVLITGGTKGLGRAAVARFLSGGARVITSARGQLEPIDGVEFVQADLTTAEGGDTLAKAAHLAAQSVTPISDIRASRQYRLHIAELLTLRALRHLQRGAEPC